MQYTKKESAEREVSTAKKMAVALMAGWQRGERKLVKQIINNATGREARERWYVETAMLIEDVLGKDKYGEFVKYMVGSAL